MFSSLVPKAKAAPAPSRFSEDEIESAQHYKWWLVFLALKKRQLEGIADLSQAPTPEPIEPDVDQLLAAWTPPQPDQPTPSVDTLLSTWDEAAQDTDIPTPTEDINPASFQVPEPSNAPNNSQPNPEPTHLAANLDEALPELDPEVHPAMGLTAASHNDADNPIS